MVNDKKRNLGIVLGIGTLLIMVIGVTYAAFQYTKAGSKENTLTTGTISFKYNETSNGITLSNAMPMQDSEGKNMQKGEGEGDNGYFDFNVDSHLGADTEVQYYVYAVDVTGDIENKLDPKYVKVYLTDQSTPENVYQGYDEEVPVYTDLDDIEAQSSDEQSVTGKLLYKNKFTESGTHFYRLRLWVSNDYEDNKVARTFKMRVDVNTDAEVTPVVKDSEKPTCTIENAKPKNASRDEDITMTIKCTDDNGTVTSNMTKDNIHVKVNNEVVEPTKKELTEGIAATEVTGENGIQHTLTLNGFNKEGKISVTIDAGVVRDQYENTNDEVTLDTDVNIARRVTVTLANGGGVTSFGDIDELTCDLKDSETCNVTLPTITPQDGYTGSFWSEEETAHEGEQPGQIEVSSDKTYYAIGEKEVTATFTPGEGVESVGKESDKCKYYGKETSCKVELPTIKEKDGYSDGKWSLTSGSPEIDAGEQVDASDSSTAKYTAKAKDTEAPVCKVYNAIGRKVNKSNTVDVQIDCTDNSGNIKQDLTAEPLKTLIDGKDVTLTKSISDTTPIENGKRYTVHLEGFKNLGPLTITIPENTVLDNSDKGNIETNITTEVTINDTIKITLVKGDGVSSIEDKTELTCEIEKDGSGCNVTLPNITPEVEGFTGYWSTENNAHSGENPGQITVTNNDTYYALVKKDLTMTYTKAGGVVSTGKESDTCTLYGNDKSCSVELPDITVTEGYTGSFWSDSASGTQGKNPKDPVTLTEDDEYYARGYKDVTATYEKTDNVQTLSKDNDTCRRLGDAPSCEVTLPTITGNKGYTQTYWGANDNTEYASRIQDTKVSVTDNTTYYAFAKDIEAPVCKFSEITPSNPTTTDTISLKIDCTDNSGNINKNLTANDLTIKINGEDENPTTKTLSSTTNIANGKRYTFNLSGFSSYGILTILIAENAVTDNSNNKNIETTLNPNINISFSWNGTLDKIELEVSSALSFTHSTYFNTSTKNKFGLTLTTIGSNLIKNDPRILDWTITPVTEDNYGEVSFGNWHTCSDSPNSICSSSEDNEFVLSATLDKESQTYNNFTLSYNSILSKTRKGIYEVTVKSASFIKTTTNNTLSDKIRIIISPSNVYSCDITHNGQKVSSMLTVNLNNEREIILSPKAYDKEGTEQSVINTNWSIERIGGDTSSYASINPTFGGESIIFLKSGTEYYQVSLTVDGVQCPSIMIQTTGSLT